MTFIWMTIKSKEQLAAQRGEKTQPESEQPESEPKKRSLKDLFTGKPKKKEWARRENSKHVQIKPQKVKVQVLDVEPICLNV